MQSIHSRPQPMKNLVGQSLRSAAQSLGTRDPLPFIGDLIERNIATYTQISTDMRTIESELDSEILTPPPAKYAVPATEAERVSATAQEAAQSRTADAPRERSKAAETNVREEIFDESYQKKEKPRAKGSHGFSIVLLILVSLLLLWVVAGVAMTMQWIPAYDLGYSWFNLHVFKLF